MSQLTDIVERVRSLDLNELLRLRPPYPPVAVQFDRDALSLVRLKKGRRGLPVLEASKLRPIDSPAVPDSIFEPAAGPDDELQAQLGDLLESSGTRPGRLSAVIPDNLAKITLIHLPERPASRRQLDELVRSKMRRAVPFRLEDASISFQVLPAEGKAITLLVVLVRRSLVERIEKSLETLGARVGLVDLCTPNLINLCRSAIAELNGGGDAALLNCDRRYFSLAIVRDQQLIFFRCKTYNIGDEAAGGPNGVLSRELAGSISYYQEKLGGQGIGTVFVRSVGAPIESIVERVERLGLGRARTIDPAQAIDFGDQPGFDPVSAQQLAPAIGAAVGR